MTTETTPLDAQRERLAHRFTYGELLELWTERVKTKAALAQAVMALYTTEELAAILEE